MGQRWRQRRGRAEQGIRTKQSSATTPTGVRGLAHITWAGLRPLILPLRQWLPPARRVGGRHPHGARRGLADPALPTIAEDGSEASLEIPAGTPSGKVFTLKGKGVSRLSGRRGNGNQHVGTSFSTMRFIVTAGWSIYPWATTSDA